MSSDWAQLTIGQLVESGEAIVQTGPFGSQLHSYDYVDMGVPVIPTEAIGRGRITDIKVPCITKEKAQDLHRHRLQAGDILFARRGAQATGLSAIVDARYSGAICGTGALLLRTKSQRLLPEFLAHLLASDASYDWLRTHAVGAVMPNINTDIIRALPVLVPPIETQHDIAAFLSAIESRITLLRETNATLEAIAQALFKSWFVDFDPVRAKRDGRAPEGMDEATAALFPDSFEDSELGEVPRGWRVMPMVEAYELNPTRKLSKGTPAPYLDMANVPTQGFGVAEVTMRELGSGTRFIAGDTLLARITPCLENGKSAFVDFLKDKQVGWGSTEFVVLRPRHPLPAFHAYLLCRHQPFREHAVQSMSGTSGRQRIQNDVLGRYLLAVPPAPVAIAFEETIAAIQRKATANNALARTLATLRDTLHPRLISGQLRLPEACDAIDSALASA